MNKYADLYIHLENLTNMFIFRKTYENLCEAYGVEITDYSLAFRDAIVDFLKKDNCDELVDFMKRTFPNEPNGDWHTWKENS